MIQDKENNPLNADYNTSSDLSGLSIAAQKNQEKVKRKKKTASGIYQKLAKTLKNTKFINEKLK